MRFLLLGIIALFAFQCAVAQETTAGVQGTVKDSSGAVIAGATVEISGPALLGTRKVQTDSGGNYRIAALPPGEYTLTVCASGFNTYKHSGIDLPAGRLPNIDIQMQAGALAQAADRNLGSVRTVMATYVAVGEDNRLFLNSRKGREPGSGMRKEQ